jgi:hypothetical protein
MANKQGSEPGINDPIPASQAAMILGRSRECVIRLVQSRKLTGELRGGRWIVSSRDAYRFARATRRQQDPAA